MDERLGQSPQLVTGVVVTVGLLGAPMTAGLCDDPCAKPHPGQTAILPENVDIDVVPTRANYTPVISIPIASGGTVAP